MEKAREERYKRNRAYQRKMGLLSFFSRKKQVAPLHALNYGANENTDDSRKQDLYQEPDILKEIDRHRGTGNQRGQIELWLSNGEVISNLEELALAIPRMKMAQFSEHVNKEKNEFADWVKDVFEEEKLAKHLNRVRTKKQTEAILLTHLKHRHKKEAHLLFLRLFTKAQGQVQERDISKAQTSIQHLKELLNLDIITDKEAKHFTYFIKELEVDMSLAKL